ncbi:hypothetical protein FHT98_5086 [Bosea sp. AK1]|uniref:hypothetical protein n=1 Tax=Bosea sp. AK1 TaxID=2587160 RepID=UPI00114E9D51|nr:hypothetical protein [Bosea sp. AK1]TQI65219.1 hypothetical protein FHT98_5086 [Bosea sp. AK1]
MEAQVAPSLREAFEQASVAKIAIVDDGYDPPNKAADLEEGNWGAVLEVLEGTPARANELFNDRRGKGANIAPAFGDLTPKHINELWEIFTDAKPEEIEADVFLKSLKPLFSRYLAGRDAKLSELRHVEDFVLAATGYQADRLNSQTDPHTIAKYDLVLLDFYLGDEIVDGEISPDQQTRARENAKKVIRATMKASSDRRCPLFILISSRATQEDIPIFRDEAELLASKFRFLAKPEFRDHPRKVEFELKTLVSNRAPADAIELLIERWQSIVEESTGEMVKSIRRLDVADYAYMQNYRLSEEKILLLEYLTWMFNSYLGALVERRMMSDTTIKLDELYKAANLPPALPPMSELPRIYSEITTSQVPTCDHEGSPIKVWTGDLFVRRELLPLAGGEATADAIAKSQVTAAVSAADAHNGIVPAAGDRAVAADAPQPGSGGQRSTDAKKPRKPDVLAVVTPVCDLIPGRLTAKSVVLTGGTLKEFGAAPMPSNHLLVLDRPGRAMGMVAKPYQVDWDPAWPQAFEHSDFDGSAILGTDYVKVSRLREVYAAELAGTLSGSLGRVGVPVAPPFSQALGARLLYRPNGNGKARELLSAPAEQPVAWEFYRARSRPSRHCGIDSAFIWTIMNAAKAAGISADHPAFSILSDPEAWRELITPFEIKNGKWSRGPLTVLRIAAVDERDIISEPQAHVVVQLIGHVAIKEE